MGKSTIVIITFFHTLLSKMMRSTFLGVDPRDVFAGRPVTDCEKTPLGHLYMYALSRAAIVKLHVIAARL